MAKLTGKNLYLKFGSTVLSGTQRSLEVNEEIETADATAGADDYRNYLTTVKTIGATVELVMREHADSTSPNGSAIFAALVLGTEGTLEWGVEGTATGKPRKGFVARVTRFDQNLAFDDVYTISVEFSNAGTALVYDGYLSKY